MAAAIAVVIPWSTLRRVGVAISIRVIMTSRELRTFIGVRLVGKKKRQCPLGVGALLMHSGAGQLLDLVKRNAPIGSATFSVVIASQGLAFTVALGNQSIRRDPFINQARAHRFGPILRKV